MAARFTDGGQRTLADRFLRESHDAAFRAQLIRRAISENGVAERGG